MSTRGMLLMAYGTPGSLDDLPPLAPYLPQLEALGDEELR